MSRPARNHVLPERFFWIDALRGLAALAVVIYHYHHFYLADYLDRPNLPPTTSFPYAWLFEPFYVYGKVAVQLFWVISGFVFAHVYIPRPVSARGFLAARVARLYPLHFATLLLVAALQIVSQHFAGHWQIYGNNDLRHFGLQLFMASNSVKLSHGLSFNGPIWSVSLEIASYAIFFFGILPIRRLGLLVSVPLCAVAWWIAMTPGLDIPIMTRGVFDAAGYFFLGTSLYLLYRNSAGRPLALSLVAALMLGVALLGWGRGSERFVLAGLSAVLVLVTALLDQRLARTGRKLGGLGDISYSLYLVHVPLQMMILLAADLLFAGDRSFAEHWALLPAYLLAAVVIAHVVYRRFERPAGRRLRAVFSPPSAGKQGEDK